MSNVSPDCGWMPQPTDPERRGRRHVPAIVAVIVFVLLVLGGAGLAVVWAAGKLRVPVLAAAPIETPEARAANLRAAYAATADGVTADFAPGMAEADVDAIRALLHRFDRAMQRGSARLLDDCIDPDRLYQEMVRTGAMPRLGLLEERDYLTMLRNQLASTMISEVMGITWTQWEICRITPIDLPGEAIVSLRCVLNNEIFTRLRWWVRRQPDGTWRFYDSEDVDMGLRRSRLTGALTRAAMNSFSPPPWAAQAPRLFAVEDLVAKEEYDAAARRLRGLASARFPQDFEVYRLTRLAEVLLYLEQHDEAEVAVNRALALRPDLPIGHYYLSTIRLGQDRPEEALVAVDHYVELLGPDRDTESNRGLALLALGRRDEAIATWRRGLDRDPEAMMLLVDLASNLEPGERGEVVERFSAMSDPAPHAESLLVALWEENDLDTMEAIASRLRAVNPGDTNADYYEAQVRLGQDRPDEAVRLLEAALPRAPADEEEAFREALAEALIYADRPVDAYRLYRDRPDDLDTVMDLLEWTLHAEHRTAVLDEHEQAHPDDPRTLFYRGQIEMDEERFGTAIDLLRQACDAAANLPDLHDRARAHLVTALYSSGRGMEAYQTVPPASDTARQLGFQSLGDENMLFLERLIAVVRADDPEHPLLPLWQAEVHWHAEEYEAVVDLLADTADDVADEPGALWRTEDRLIRSLLRLDRHGEALAAAERSTARDDNPFFEVIVHAVAGDPDRAAAAFARYMEQGYAPDGLYDDEDAGPALAGEVYAALRAEHPRWWGEDVTAGEIVEAPATSIEAEGSDP